MALVSMAEAARRLGYHPSSIRRALEAQGIPLVREGSVWYVDEADLARAERRPRHRPPARATSRAMLIHAARAAGGRPGFIAHPLASRWGEEWLTTPALREALGIPTDDAGTETLARLALCLMPRDVNDIVAIATEFGIEPYRLRALLAPRLSDALDQAALGAEQNAHQAIADGDPEGAELALRIAAACRRLADTHRARRLIEENPELDPKQR
jgi:hypothetical protein